MQQIHVLSMILWKYNITEQVYKEIIMFCSEAIQRSGRPVVSHLLMCFSPLPTDYEPVSDSAVIYPPVSLTLRYVSIS